MRYRPFLIPGLVMMSVLQNAFANSSSSLIQSKVTAISSSSCCRRFHAEFFAGATLAAVMRGLMVGVGVLAVTAWFAPLDPWRRSWIVVFAVLAAVAIMGLARHDCRHLGLTNSISWPASRIS